MARCVWLWSGAAVPDCNTPWIWSMDQKSATFSSRPRAFASWSIRKARSLLAAQSSTTARTCKKADSKSPIRTRSRTVRAAKASRCDFSSAFLSLPFAYGVAEGEAVGEADSSAAAFFFVVFFAAGDAEASADADADAEVFFVVEVFLAEVDVPWV